MVKYTPDNDDSPEERADRAYIYIKLTAIANGYTESDNQPVS